MSTPMRRLARGAPPETVREWADGTDGRCAIKSPRGRTGKAVVLVAGGRARGHRYVAMVLNPGLYSAHKRSTTLVGAKRRQLLMQLGVYNKTLVSKLLRVPA
jgi:hypothetical protein